MKHKKEGQQQNQNPSGDQAVSKTTERPYTNEKGHIFREIRKIRRSHHLLQT